MLIYDGIIIERCYHAPLTCINASISAFGESEFSPAATSLTQRSHSLSFGRIRRSSVIYHDRFQSLV